MAALIDRVRADESEFQIISELDALLTLVSCVADC
jgi:hypothetical protein